MEERSVEMEMKMPKIKSMKPEDFKNNEYIQKLVDELNGSGANIVVGKLNERGVGIRHRGRRLPILG